MVRSESRLGGVQEVVGIEVVSQSLVDEFFQDFGHVGEEGDGSVICQYL